MSAVNRWGAALYGDPCRECGFTWKADLDADRLVVASAPMVYGALLEGARGTERHPELDWDATAYVCHVADNLRIWAERLGGRVSGAGPEVGPYDEAALARARRYDRIPLAAARWSLADAATGWVTALDAVAAVPELSRSGGDLLVHPERGTLSLVDVAAANAHDTAHHEWDIRRIIGAAGRPLMDGV